MISALYALVLLIQIEPMGNVYRITRVTNWSIITVDRLILIFNLVIFIFSTVIFYLFTRKYLSTGKSRYLLTVLWIPYFAIFTYIFSSLFPITNPGDDPAPVLGLIIIGIFLIYPFYIALINAISPKTEDN
jgi:hypothetical protein